MAIHVLLSAGISSLCDNQSRIDLEAITVRDAVTQLTGRYHALAQKLFRPDGKRNPFVNIYVNSEDIRYLNELDTPLKEGDELDFIAGVSGG